MMDLSLHTIFILVLSRLLSTLTCLTVHHRLWYLIHNRSQETPCKAACDEKNLSKPQPILAPHMPGNWAALSFYFPRSFLFPLSFFCLRNTPGGRLSLSSFSFFFWCRMHRMLKKLGFSSCTKGVALMDSLKPRSILFNITAASCSRCTITLTLLMYHLASYRAEMTRVTGWRVKHGCALIA